MGKQWARQQVKRNELELAVEKTVEWVKTNQQTAITSAVVAGIALALAAYMFVHHRQYQRMRLDRLSQGFYTMMAGQADEALNIFNDLIAKSPGDKVAAHALLHKASILYKQGKWEEAQATLKNFVGQFPKDERLTPLALIRLGSLEEGTGDYPTSKETYQHLLDTYPEHFLAPNAYDGLGRVSLLMNEKEEAKRCYEKLLTLYPNSSWTKRAQAILDQLQS